MSLVVDGVTVATTICKFWAHYALVMTRRFGTDKQQKQDLVDFLAKRPRLAIAFTVSDKAVTSFLGRKVAAPIDDSVIETMKVLVHLYDESLKGGVFNDEDLDIFDDMVKDMEDTMKLYSFKGAGDGLAN